MSSNNGSETLPVTTDGPSLRPGISNATLAKLEIRHITAAEALDLVGLEEPGIYIPYPGVTEPASGQFGRLRMDRPKGDKKYHQRYQTKTHNYILPELTLHEGDLIMVEGEFKAVSLIEAGFPAMGISGFYSWGRKASDGTPILNDDFEAAYTQLNPKRVVFVGDPDTALNFFFSDAMTKLNGLIDVPLALVQIDYHAPNGKGVDDIKATLGETRFKTWFQFALDNAEEIPKDMTRDGLIFHLIERERVNFGKLAPGSEALEKAKSRLTKLGAFLKKDALRRLGEVAKEIFGVKKVDYIADVNAERDRQVEEREQRQRQRNMRGSPQTGTASDMQYGEQLRRVYSPSNSSPDSDNTSAPAPANPFGDAILELIEMSIDPSQSGGGGSGFVSEPDWSYDGSIVLSSFMMIGEAYYTYSYIPNGRELVRSETMSVCSREFVSKSLKAAGFSGKRKSSASTPICGRIPNLSEVEAALYYLHATRCTGFVDLLYRPYGPYLQPNNIRVFNRTRVQVMPPQGNVTDLSDPSINLITFWLSMFFSNAEQPLAGNLEHFISLLSHAYKAAYEGKPKKTRAVFLIGPPDSGKSWMIDKLLPMIFGQEHAGDAHRLLKGEMGASPVLANYVCKVSDKELGGPNEIKKAQQALLGLLADFNTGGRALYENVTTVEVINLFTFSSNPDGSVVKLLEDMPDSVREKLAVYDVGPSMDALISSYPMVFAEHVKIPEGGVWTRQDALNQMYEQLPYFCSLLLNWEIPREIADDRFGVCGWSPQRFTDPSMLKFKEQQVYDILVNFDIPEKTSARNIRTEMIKKTEDPGLENDIRGHEMVHILTKLSEVVPDLVQMSKYAKSAVFSVTGSAYLAKLKAEQQEAASQSEGQNAALLARREAIRAARRAAAAPASASGPAVAATEPPASVPSAPSGTPGESADAILILTAPAESVSAPTDKKTGGKKKTATGSKSPKTESAGEAVVSVSVGESPSTASEPPASASETTAAPAAEPSGEANA